jgi:hypothetical protein
VTTFGQDPAAWVSLTIDPVVCAWIFLNDSEKAILGPAFDDHGRVI